MIHQFTLIPATADLKRPVERMVYGTTRVLAHRAMATGKSIQQMVAAASHTGDGPENDPEYDTTKRIKGAYCAIITHGNETPALEYDENEMITIKVFVAPDGGPSMDTKSILRTTLNLDKFPFLRHLHLVLECVKRADTPPVVLPPSILITGCGTLENISVHMIGDIAPDIILTYGVAAERVEVINRTKSVWFGVPALLTTANTISVSGKAGLPIAPTPITPDKMRFRVLEVTDGSLALYEWMTQMGYPGAHYRISPRHGNQRPEDLRHPDNMFGGYRLRRM